MAKEITTAKPTSIDLGKEVVPILPSWVLDGNPVTRSKNIVRSHDWTANVVVWECGMGQFNWRYGKDEVVVVVSGEVFLTPPGEAQERRLGPGDMAFFPAGTSCIWRVPEHVRKVAVLRETMWRPLGLALKVWKKLLRTIGIGGASPL